MSKAAYWQRGEALDYKNTGTAKIEANTIIVLGNRIGVAGMDIAVGEVGTLHVTGVYSCPKATTDAIDAGADLYFDKDEGLITDSATKSVTEGETTSTVNNVKAGFACEAAAAADAVVLVKINA